MIHLVTCLASLASIAVSAVVICRNRWINRRLDVIASASRR